MSLPQVEIVKGDKVVKGLPYKYEAVEVIPGSAMDLNETTPKLFQPIKVGSLTFPNRIGVSPMAQYSADEGKPTEYHKVHYGSLALRGTGLIVAESTSVDVNGVCSVGDTGIYNDEQAKKWKEVVDFVHANASTIGLQLGHGGRKAGTSPYYVSFEKSDPRFDPNTIVAPSPIEFRKNGRLPKPRELTKDEIKDIIKNFGSAAKRAVEIAGFDFVEIHGAHGYLVTEFLSPITNKRTDEYGGSYENRIKFLLEIIDEIKANVPKDYPIFLRIHGSDLDDSVESWTVDDAAKLAVIVAKEGISLIDVSSGANHPNAARSNAEFGVNLELAKKIKVAVKAAVGDATKVSTVGKLHDAKKVNELLEAGDIDLAFVGSPFLFNPGLVFQWATELGVRINNTVPLWINNPPIAELMEYLKSVKLDD